MTSTRTRVGVVGFAVALCVTLILGARGVTAQEPDHYVLALSWSPTFCMNADRERERLQCAPSADHTFVVHGLWPNAGTDRLAYCNETRGLPRRTVRGMLEIMPSPGLVAHQWRKHGTCSGMDAEGYFATVRDAAARVALPDGLETADRDQRLTSANLREAFLTANPGLPEQGITVQCRDRRLVEVRLCMTLDLTFRDCPDPLRRRCEGRKLAVPAPE